MTASDKYYDELETRDPELREAEQLTQLSAQVAHAKAKTNFYGERFKDIAAGDVDSRQALAQLPVTRKSDLAAFQKRERPLGGLNAVPLRELRHIFASPGGIYEPGTNEPDNFRFARSLWAAGVRPGDIIHNTYSYHLVPAGLFVESGAHAIGCPVFPGGVGNSELQLQAIADVRPDFFVGTPSFLRILLEKAQELGSDTSSLKKGLVGAEALPPSLRELLSGYGVDVLQGYGTADLGAVAYESEAIDGMIFDEGIFVELVEPQGSAPVAEGEVGEIVVTTYSKAYPLIRFATGDLTQILPGISPCGRTNLRMKGWMGRADQSTKVRGMFVRPDLIGAVMARHPEIKKARLVVTSIDNKDQMTLKVAADGAGAGFEAAVVESIQSVMKLRGEVEIVSADKLPDDGILVEDARTYE